MRCEMRQAIYRHIYEELIVISWSTRTSSVLLVVVERSILVGAQRNVMMIMNATHLHIRIVCVCVCG